MTRQNRDNQGGSSSRNKNRSNKNRDGRRNNRQRRYGSTLKSTLEERNASEIARMEEQARSRFEQSPLPLGFPEDTPEPKTFSFDWATVPVPLKDEEAMAGKVMRKGEFGWLEDERVDQIAVIAEGY